MNEDIRWFSTKSNGVRFHAARAENPNVALCNASIGPRRLVAGVRPGQPESSLPEYAELCPRCKGKVDQHATRNQDTFTDWGSAETELELDDNGDSISFTTRLVGPWATLEVGVRIRPDDLDRLERRIREIRQARGI